MRMNTALSATTFLTAAFLCVQVQWAQADFVAPLPPKPPAAKAPDQSSGKGKSGAKVGKFVFACVAAAAGSEFVGVNAVGDGNPNPRDQTMLESQRSAERGCPVFAVLRPLYRWPDTKDTYEIAGLSHAWRKTPRGRDNFAMCHRGAMDGCATTDNDIFARAMVGAYHGEAVAKFVKEWRAKVGVKVVKKKSKTIRA